MARASVTAFPSLDRSPDCLQRHASSFHAEQLQRHTPPPALHLQSLRDHAHFTAQQTEAEQGSPSRPRIAKLEPFLSKTSTARTRGARVELEPHL